MEERMRRLPTLCLVLACLTLLALAPGPLAAAKRPITEQDLFRFVWIADPQISPDGSRVAFVRARVNEKTDGRSVAFLSATTDEDLARAARKKDGKPDGSERDSDVRIVTLATYREDNEGYSDPRHHAHLWTVAVPAADGEKAAPKRITSGPYDEGSPAWSPDGTQIDFTADRSLEPYYELPTSALYSVPAAGGDVARVLAMEGVIGSFRFAPGGRQVAFVGALTRPARSYDQPQLFVSDAAPGSRPRAVAPGLDRDVGSGIIGDQHAPRGGAESPPFWNADGRSVIAAVSDQGTANLRHFEVKTGRAQTVTGGNQEVSAWTATPDGSRIVVLVSTPTSLGDLYLVGAD